MECCICCYMLHSWWNVAHTGNVRLLYATELMECCTCRQSSSVICSTQLMECCTYRRCSSVICYTADGMWHIQAMFVCYMLHSWWNVAHTGNARLLYATQLMGCCTYRKCASVIFAHTGNVRLLYDTELMECCTYRQCSSVICSRVDGMLHIQAMFICYMLHSRWNVAHTGNVRLLYATQLMECCTYRQCSSVICYTVDGMLHIQAMCVCYILHS